MQHACLHSTVAPRVSSHENASSHFSGRIPHQAARSVQCRATATQGLLQALRNQVQKETVPWLRDLLYPLTAGPPEPLLDTVDPQLLADPDSSFVEVDGVLLHCKDVGPRAPGTPSVVLLHGFNGSTFSWRLVIEAIAKAGEGCRVVAVDRPPFGLSERPLSWPQGLNPYSNAGNAKLVTGLIQKLGLHQPVIVGHSQGALVAMEVYRRIPELVSALVFVGAALPGNSSESSFARRMGLGRQLQLLLTRAIMASDGPGLQYIRRSIRERAAEVQKGGQLGVFSDDRVASAALIEGYLKPMRAHNWDKGSLYGFRSMSFPSVLDYSKVAVPVQFIHGEHDCGLKKAAKQVYDILSADSERQRQGIPTEFAEIPACGHSPMDEKDAEFVSALVPFLERLSGQRARGKDAAAITDSTTDTVLPALELNLDGDLDAVPVSSSGNAGQRLQPPASQG